MELLQLHYFYEVARNLHVTRTAEQLNVAQPALTQGIHRLEKELGVKLFRKSGRNIVLTEYGTYLKERITPVLQTLEQIPEHIKEMANVRKNTLHINVLAASAIVTRAIIQYQQEHDDIHFQVMQNSEYKYADITISTIDQFIMPKKSLDKFMIFTEDIFLAVPCNEKFRCLNEISLCDLKDEKFISLTASKAFRKICDRFCMQSGFTPKTIFESDSPGAVQDLISAGLGVGFWPHYTWGKNEVSKVLILPIKEPICRRDVVIRLTANGEAVHTEAQKFFNFIGEYIRKQAYIN